MSNPIFEKNMPKKNILIRRSLPGDFRFTKTFVVLYTQEKALLFLKRCFPSQIYIERSILQNISITFAEI